MLLTAIRLQAAGIGALVLADANHLPVYALLLTFLASVVKQFFDSSALKNKWERDRLDAETRRKWEREDRQLVATTLASNTAVVKDHADTLAVTMQAHSLASTIVLTPVLDGATNKIYLNVAGATDGSNAAYVDATGTVTLFVIDLGNITS